VDGSLGQNYGGGHGLGGDEAEVETVQEWGPISRYADGYHYCAHSFQKKGK